MRAAFSSSPQFPFFTKRGTVKESEDGLPLLNQGGGCTARGREQNPVVRAWQQCRLVRSSLVAHAMPTPTRAQRLHAKGFSAREISTLTGQRLHRVQAQIAGEGGNHNNRGYHPPARLAGIASISDKAANLLRSGQPKNAREEAWLDGEIQAAARRIRDLNDAESGLVRAVR